MKHVTTAIRLYFWIVLFALICWLTYLLTQTNLYNSDFRVFYSSGVILQTTPSKLYANDQQERIQQQFFPAKNEKFYTLSFINPPYLALLFAPLAWLPVSIAFGIWVSFNVVLFVICIYLLKSEFRQNLSLLQLLLEASVFIPFFVTLKNGQTSLISLFLLLVIQYCLHKNKPFSAGLLTSFLWYKPQLAMFFTLYWLFRGKFSFFKGLVIGGVFLGVLSFLILGADLRTFFATFISYVSSSSPEHSKEAMISWQGFAWQLHRYLPTVSPALLTIILTCLTLLIVGIFLKSRKRDMKASNQTLAFLVPLILLCGIHVHVHDAVLLLIPFSGLQSCHRGLASLFVVGGYVVFLLAYFSPFYPSVFPFVPTLYLLGLLVYLGIRLQRQSDVL